MPTLLRMSALLVLLPPVAVVVSPLRRPGGEPGRVAAVRADGTLVLRDGTKLRLQGIDTGRKAPAALRRALLDLVGDDGYEARIDGEDPLRRNVRVGLLRRRGTARSVNEELLGRGLAFFRTTTDRCPEQGALLGAALRAREAGRGVWKGVLRRSGPLPPQRGGALGLYYKLPRLDYHRQIDRVQAIGADWVQLLFTLFVDRVDSSLVERDRTRTVPDARLRETIGYARRKGLRVALLPIVLIRHAGDDDWRGTLRPADPGRFWRSYEAALRHYLDIARETGVELFSIGSELCSLEGERDVWVRLIHNARGRFGGWLTYSVNWDHYEVPRFWHLLDQVGMTGYFELTDDDDPDPADLEAAWRRVRREIEGVAKRLGRPVVLTELGYASQNGANTAPWNYYLAQDQVDLDEQADCFRAFAAVMDGAGFLDGVYVFGFFEEGGPEDFTYAIWGKPAWNVVKGFLARFPGR